MTSPNTQPVFEVIGGTEPTDELLELLADWLLDLVDSEDADQ